MNCPNCGSPRAKYVESRRKFWGERKGFKEPSKEPRKNFEVKCKKCGKAIAEPKELIRIVKKSQ